MKIGIILPIGDLGSFGYQYYPYNIVKNHLEFADTVAIISSTSKNPRKLPIRSSKIIYHSSPQSWFTRIRGREVFSYNTLNKNVNLGLDLLKENKCDIVLEIHINQYIPENSKVTLRNYLKEILDTKKPYGWLYKKYQLGEKVFNADIRLPWIINLQTSHTFRFSVDSIEDNLSTRKVNIQSGHYSSYNNRAIMDIMLNYKIDDAKKLFMFTHKENLRVSHRLDEKPTFNEIKWYKYYLDKINQKTISSENLDAFGRWIENSRLPNFLSYKFENDYKPLRRVNIIRRLLS